MFVSSVQEAKFTLGGRCHSVHGYRFFINKQSNPVSHCIRNQNNVFVNQNHPQKWQDWMPSKSQNYKWTYLFHPQISTSPKKMTFRIITMVSPHIVYHCQYCSNWSLLPKKLQKGLEATGKEQHAMLSLTEIFHLCNLRRNSREHVILKRTKWGEIGEIWIILLETMMLSDLAKRNPECRRTIDL